MIQTISWVFEVSQKVAMKCFLHQFALTQQATVRARILDQAPPLNPKSTQSAYCWLALIHLAFVTVYQTMASISKNLRHYSRGVTKGEAKDTRVTNDDTCAQYTVIGLASKGSAIVSQEPFNQPVNAIGKARRNACILNQRMQQNCEPLIIIYV